VGVEIPCPECGVTGFQHSMIPVLGEGGTGIRYVCRECARKLIDTAQTVAQAAPATAPAS
jgi:hypothetical protein